MQAAIEEYAADRGVSYLEVPLEADGPSAQTAFRWTRLTERLDIKSWLELRLQSLDTAWRKTLLPDIEHRHPEPAEARPFAWKLLQMARCYGAGSNPLTPACFLQLAKLELAA